VPTFNTQRREEKTITGVLEQGSYIIVHERNGFPASYPTVGRSEGGGSARGSEGLSRKRKRNTSKGKREKVVESKGGAREGCGKGEKGREWSRL